MSSLTTIFSEGRQIEVGAKKVLIKGIELQHLPLAIAVGSSVIEAFDADKKKLPALITKLMSEDFDKAIALMAACTDLSTEDLKKLNLGAATIILTEIISENADFLQSHVVPAFNGMAEKMKKMSGPTKSKG